LLAELAASAKGLGVRFVVPAGSAAGALLPKSQEAAEGRFGAGLDAVLSLGGDGTVLQAVRLLGGRATPILGINLGHLGFLTAVPAEEAPGALEAVVKGGFGVCEAPLLAAGLYRAGGRKASATYRALNDVVMGWGTSTRATMIELAIDGEPVASYVADGFIVATPIGSTGHALSAGGPILHREARAMVLAPICPHTLSSRPLVLPDTSCVELSIADRRKKLLLSVDGAATEWLSAGDRLKIRRSAKSVRFIQLASYSWPRLLTQKLHWRGSSADPK
jgi:Predicted sugar kinase